MNEGSGNGPGPKRTVVILHIGELDEDAYDGQRVARLAVPLEAAEAVLASTARCLPNAVIAVAVREGRLTQEVAERLLFWAHLVVPESVSRDRVREMLLEVRDELCWRALGLGPGAKKLAE